MIMPMSKEQILAAAMCLDPDVRRELAEDIFQSIDDGPLTPEQQEELRIRAEAIDRGEMALIPAEEALRRLRERAHR